MNASIAFFESSLIQSLATVLHPNLDRPGQPPRSSSSKHFKPCRMISGIDSQWRFAYTRITLSKN
jgi:hypothetical protein